MGWRLSNQIAAGASRLLRGVLSPLQPLCHPEAAGDQGCGHSRKGSSMGTAWEIISTTRLWIKPTIPSKE